LIDFVELEIWERRILSGLNQCGVRAGLREPRFMSSERRIAGTLACKEDSLIPASISETVMGLGGWKQFWGKLIAPGPSRRSKRCFCSDWRSMRQAISLRHREVDCHGITAIHKKPTK